MTVYVPRLTKPTKTDPNFILDDYGGNNRVGILGNPLYATGSALANCVGYCYGRWLELGLNQYDLPQGSAGFWWSRFNGTKGQTPKLGAIMCWHRVGYSTGVGHVEVVERIPADASEKMTISKSAYGGVTFSTVKYSQTNPKKNGYEFLGYLYSPVEFENPDDPDPEDTKKSTGASLKISDKVKIVGYGNSRADGTGRRAYGIGYHRMILKIYEGKPYPYRVGTNAGTTGFYPAESLKKEK